MNQVNLMGRICYYVKRTTTAEREVTASFKVAVVSVAGKNKTRMDYILCRAWGDMAENIFENYFRNSYVAVSGNLRTDSWYEGGRQKFITYVAVKQIADASDFSKNENPNQDEI